MKLNFNWEELAEKTKQKAQIESDSDLADLLGVTRAAISEWRNGRNDLGWLVKLRILDLLGYQWARDAILALVPADKAAIIIKKNNELTMNLNRKKARNDKKKK